MSLALRTKRPGAVILYLAIVVVIARSTHSAPVHESDSTQVAAYEKGGCYYNFQHYQEGARIITNEPCLNCTCHNRMLMCYLRVCPFTKAIGQDCTVEKRPDQCCPVITCPEVPVQLLTSTTSSPSKSDSTGLAALGSTELGFPDTYGCNVNERFYADGAQLPVDSNNPCELCYCIRNKTTCLMQQCTLSVAGCRPVYQPGICCPVKYNCEYDEVHDASIGTTPGLIMTTTVAPHPATPPKCHYEDKMYEDGELIYTIQPCQHCYCFHGEIVCAVQECGKPMESHKKNCTALPPLDGECCPTTYMCEDDLGNIATEIPEIEKKTQESTESSESFPGADNAIPENLTTEKTQTVSPLGNEVPESEPTKSTTTEKETELGSTVQPESVKSEEVENKDQSESSDVDEKPKITTQSPEEILESTEILPKEQSSEKPAITEDDSSKVEITSVPSEISTASEKSQSNEELTTPASSEKSAENEQQLTNAIATEKAIEESTKSTVQDEKIEPGIMQTELPVESTTILSKEAEVSSESSSPVSDTETEIHGDIAQPADITTEIPTEEIKNKQTKEEESSFDTTTVSDYEESDKTTLAPSLSENTILNSEENKSEEKDASFSNESSTPKESTKSEEIDTTSEISIAAAENENKDKEQPSLDISTEKSEDTSSGIETSSPSSDEEIKSNEPISPETSTIQDVVVENSTSESEADKIYPTIPSASQESSTEENIISSSLPSSDDGSEKTNIIETSTEEQPIVESHLDDHKEEPEIPAHGPPGISIPERVPEHKAEDIDAVTDSEVTEGYLATSSGIPQQIDNLVTDQPESGPTTYLPPVDSKTEDHQPSTPLDEELPKDINEVQQQTSPDSVTPEISSGSEESVKENSEENGDFGGVTTEIPQKEISDSGADEIKIPEEVTNEPSSATDEHIVKENDSSNTSTDEGTTLSSIGFEEEKMKAEQEVSTSEGSEKIESTTNSASQENQPEIPVTDKSEENKIDENSKEIFTVSEIEKTTEKSSIDQNQSNDESFTTVSSDTTSKKSQEPEVILSTESQTITEKPFISVSTTETSNASEFETKISESSTEPNVGITETISDRLADGEKIDDKMPSDPSKSTEIHEISTTQSITEATSTETKLNDQETSNQISTAGSEEEKNKSDSEESQLPHKVSTTSSNQIIPSESSSESGSKKEENLNPETGPIDQTPEVEVKMPEIRPSHGIPGEGNCLVDGQSYSNNSAIPPANACQISCQCVSSIVQCELVQCSAPPADLSNCVPVYSSPGACCPMYTCDSTPTVELQAGNQMSGGDLQTTQKAPSEEPEDTEKTMIESSEPSITEAPESATEKSESTDIEISPASPDAGETESSSFPSASSDETASKTETEDKSGEDQSSSPADGKNDIDQEPGDSTTESIQKTPEEPSEQSIDSIPNDEKSVPLENPKPEDKSETEVVTEPTEKDLPSTDSVAGEQSSGLPSESTESSNQGTNANESIPETNQTEKPDEDGKIIPETTIISIESTESEIQKATSESTDTLISSTEKSESATSLPDENLEEQNLKDSDQTTFSTENSNIEPIITPEESVTTGPIIPDQNIFPTEKIEPAEEPSTEKISEHESDKSEDVLSEAEKTREPEISSITTEPSEPVADDSTNAAPVGNLEFESSSPSIAAETSEPFKESSESSPTTSIPISEDEMTTIPISSESVSEIQPSSQESIPTSTTNENINNQPLDEKPHDETPIETESVTEKEILTEISTEKLDELPKEEVTEASKESQSTTSTLNVSDKFNLTEQPAEIDEANHESTESTETKISSETETTENAEDQNKLEPTATEEPKLNESTTAIDEQPTDTDKETDSAKETQNEDGEEKVESTSPAKIDEESISQESSTTSESIKSEDQSSDSPIELSSEIPSGSEKYPSTEGSILETSPSGSTSSEKSDEAITPSSEIGSTVAHGIEEESSKAPEMPDELTISESPDTTSDEDSHHQIDSHPTDESIPTDAHGDDEHRPIDNDAATVHPETSKPHTRPPYPDQMVPDTPETDDQSIFPPDGADIKNQFQPDDQDTEDYDDQAVYGPGTCRYGGKIYMSAQQIPRDDACDFCFCFRSDIICLQQSCPPPIPGCHEEPIGGFCCPRYECPVSMATSLNVTTTTTTTTTTIPPHFLSHAYKGTARRGGCQIGNRAYRVGEEIKSKSGPCMGCACGGDGKMKCDPRACSASPTLKEMIAHAAAKKRRR